MKVSPIENGTVIDHIPTGRGLMVLSHLYRNNDVNGVTILASRVYSKKLEKKDIIKIEEVYLTKKQEQIIASIAPFSTYSIIKNGEPQKKEILQPPETIEDLVTCNNEKCITNKIEEPLETKFHLIQIRETSYYECHNCEKSYSLNEMGFKRI